MRLHTLVETSNAVAGTRSRLEKISRLAAAVKQLESDEIEIGVAYLSGMLRQGRVGLGWSAVADARAAGVAEMPTLELREVDAVFDRIAATRGPGAAQKRADLLGALFLRATRDEQDFLVRLISVDLRQGALEGILTDAVAAAAGAPSEIVRHAAMMTGDLGVAAKAALSEGTAALHRYGVELFRPIQPMLASTAESPSEAIQLLGEAAFEFKLDGARIQTHKAGDDVRVFSRNLRDVTAAVPEVVEVARTFPARECVLDGEVLALSTTGTPLPFQETMRRFGRRLDVDQLRHDLPLTPFFFDCLYLDGRTLLSEPQRVRFEALMSFARDRIVPHRIIGDAQEADTFLSAALERGHEGLMAKSLVAPYAAGSRGRSWLKIKMARTLDLVVLAAEWGSGRRRGWLSNLHLGARKEDRGGFVMLGKTFKGLTDETLDWQTRALLERESSRDGHIVFVRPELVVEVAFNDLQESPQYPGGLALRFARVKGYRPDKSVAEADTFRTVQEIYRRMTGRTPPQPRWSG
jgi:ATP-dependent DNA ligase I